MKKLAKPLQDKIHDVVTLEDGTTVVKAPMEMPMILEYPKPQMVVVEQGMITIKPPADNSLIRKESVNKTVARDADGNPIGHTIELFKNGKFVTTILDSLKPGELKGYFLHKIRTTNLICIKGKVKVIVYASGGREEYTLSAETLERLHIPVGMAIGLSNQWKTEAWIINDPSPAYDPNSKDEQVQYTKDQCEAGLHLKK